MYIEFDLTPGSPYVFGNSISGIRADIDAWAAKYGIECRHKAVKQTYRLTFDDSRTYEFFALTWNPKDSLYVNWRFVEPMDAAFGKE